MISRLRYVSCAEEVSYPSGAEEGYLKLSCTMHKAPGCASGSAVASNQGFVQQDGLSQPRWIGSS